MNPVLIFPVLLFSFTFSVSYLSKPSEKRLKLNPNGTMETIERSVVLKEFLVLKGRIYDIMRNVGAATYLQGWDEASCNVITCRGLEKGLKASLNLLNPLLEEDSFDDILGIGRSLLERLQSEIKGPSLKMRKTSHSISVHISSHETDDEEEYDDDYKGELDSLSENLKRVSVSSSDDGGYQHEDDLPKRFMGRVKIIPDDEDEDEKVDLKSETDSISRFFRHDSDDIFKVEEVGGVGNGCSHRCCKDPNCPSIDFNQSFSLLATLLRENVLLRFEKAYERSFDLKSSVADFPKLEFPMTFSAVKAFIISSFYNYFESIKLKVFKIRKEVITAKLNEILRDVVGVETKSRKQFISIFSLTWIDAFHTRAGRGSSLIGGNSFFVTESYVNLMCDFLFNFFKEKLEGHKRFPDEETVFRRAVKPIYDEMMDVLQDLYWDSEQSEYMDPVSMIIEAIEAYESAIKLNFLELDQISDGEKLQFGSSLSLKYVLESKLEDFDNFFISEYVAVFMEYFSPNEIPNLDFIAFLVRNHVDMYVQKFRQDSLTLIKDGAKNGNDLELGYYFPAYLLDWYGYQLETKLYERVKKISQIVLHLFSSELVKLESKKGYQFPINSDDLEELVVFLYKLNGSWETKKATRSVKKIRANQVRKIVDQRLACERLIVPPGADIFDSWTGSDSICLPCRMKILHPAIKKKVRRRPKEVF